MRRPLVALALVALVVTAGCHRDVLPETATPSLAGAGPDGTATPEPTVAATPTPNGLPPGVTENGLENLTALLAAQGRALDETGYAATASSNFSISIGGETIVRRQGRSRATYEAGGSEVFERRVVNATTTGNETTILWSNHSVTLTKTWTEGPLSSEPKTRFTHGERPNPEVGTSEIAVATILLRVFAFDVTDRNGSRVTLTASGVNRTRFAEMFGENGTIDHQAGTLVVDRRGRIRSFEGSLVAQPDENGTFTGDRVALNATYRLTAVGNVDATRPAWVSEAYAAVTIFEATVEVVDGRYVRLTNQGPDAIPAGVDVGLLQDGGGSLATLSAPVEPGESVYVYFPRDRGGPAIAREKPDAGRELSGTYEVFVAERIDNVLFRRQVTVGNGS